MQRGIAATLKIYRIANDLAMKAAAAADAGDRDWRLDTNDRPCKFGVLISGKLQI